MAINMKSASTPAATPTSTSSVASPFKKGAAAMAEMDKYEKEVAITQEQNKRMWRFFVKEGEEARITFIDGALTPEGAVEYTTYYEHNLMLNGKWGNTFVCTKDVEPCPICATSDKPSYVGVFTVIVDTIVGKDDKVYKDSVRLFVAKRETIKMLQILGAKRGGLAGCTFDVTRTGDKSPSVGSMFDFIEKHTVEELQAKYQRKNADGKMETFFVPADVSKECAYHSAEELRALIPALSQFSSAPMGSVTKADTAALEAEL